MLKGDVKWNRQHRRPNRFQVHGSATLRAGVQVKAEILPIRKRNDLELPLALAVLHTELLVGLARIGGEPGSANGTESLAIAFGQVLEVKQTQLCGDSRRNQCNARLRATISFHQHPIAPRRIIS